MFGAKQQVPPAGDETTKKRSGSAAQFVRQWEFSMKPFAPLAVAALAFGVLAWHVVPDYVSPPQPKVAGVHIVLAKVRCS